MPQVNISTSTTPAEFPTGTALGQMRFRLLDAVTQAPRYFLDSDMPLPPVVTFPNVSAGNYILHIQRLNSADTPIGTAYTAPLTVSPPAPVVGDAPVGAAVTVS